MMLCHVPMTGLYKGLFPSLFWSRIGFIYEPWHGINTGTKPTSINSLSREKFVYLYLHVYLPGKSTLNGYTRGSFWHLMLYNSLALIRIIHDPGNGIYKGINPWSFKTHPRDQQQDVFVPWIHPIMEPSMSTHVDHFTPKFVPSYGFKSRTFIIPL